MKAANSLLIVRKRPNLTAALLYFAGAGLLCAAFMNLCFVGLLARSQLPAEIVKRFVKAEACFLMASGILILLSALTRKLPWLNSLTARKEVTGALLSALILILPLFVMELVLRPFAQLEQKTTSMYLKDRDLGWRLRPNTTHVWDHKSAKINSKGILGPELDYDKPASVTRVLFLGDSVTFGEGLKTFEEAFPFLIGQKLTAQLKKPVEAINTGVGGYAPWQEALYLEKEGIKYHPDLVVVTFVLNDVIEKFGLVRFGGTGEGWQLSHSYSSFSEWLADHSGIAYFARRIGARIRFGPDVRQGAHRKETLNVRSLVDFPQRDDVKEAWKITLQEVDRIIDFCRRHDVPLLLVISPWRFQLLEENVTEWLPQKIVSDHARTRGVPVIDLLPGLIAEMKQRGEKPVECLIGKGINRDSCHFSAFGCQLVADQVSKYIAAKNLLDRSKALAAPN
jgi:hypothetical protein